MIPVILLSAIMEEVIKVRSILLGKIEMTESLPLLLENVQFVILASICFKVNDSWQVMASL